MPSFMPSFNSIPERHAIIQLVSQSLHCRLTPQKGQQTQPKLQPKHHHSILYPLPLPTPTPLSISPYLSPLLGSAVEVGTRYLAFTPLQLTPLVCHSIRYQNYDLSRFLHTFHLALYLAFTPVVCSCFCTRFSLHLSLSFGTGFPCICQSIVRALDTWAHSCLCFPIQNYERSSIYYIRAVGTRFPVVCRSVSLLDFLSHMFFLLFFYQAYVRK